LFDVTLLSDVQDGVVRRASFQTCGAVCSSRIDIELEDDVIRSVRYTGGCHGNTQGIGALVVGMKKTDVISRLSGIDCKGRGTSCPDQLSRALRML